MVKVLEDSQSYLKMFGYCEHDPTENAPSYRWSGVKNAFISYSFVYFFATSAAFISDSQQPRDERIRSFIQMVALSELAGIHFTSSAQKSKVFEFFNDFEVINNQSEFLFFQLECILFIVASKSSGSSGAVVDLYLEAERKTKAVKDGVKAYVLQPYSLVLTGSFVITVLLKIMIEKCASERIRTSIEQRTV